jgi:hypothetical protein
VSLDGTGAPPPTLRPQLPLQSPALYNFSYYDFQSLALTFHMLTITIADWQGGESEFLFDYAYINETALPPPPLSTSTTTPSTTSSPAPTSPLKKSAALHYQSVSVVMMLDPRLMNQCIAQPLPLPLEVPLVVFLPF